MTTTARRSSTAAAMLLVLTLAAGACTGDGDDPDASGATTPPTGPASSVPPRVETDVSFGRITGRLPADARKRVAAQVRDVVDGWADAAYLGGDYPRRNFSDSWPGFTAGAKRLAHRDRALMSNEDIGDRIDGVEPRRSQVRIDVLAVRQHAVGITARVLLGFRTSGRLERDIRVRGRLYLTHTDRGWRVFGYDVTKGAR